MARLHFPAILWGLCLVHTSHSRSIELAKSDDAVSWIVSIEKGEDKVCEGVQVGKDWILTLWDCVDTRKLNKYKVVMSDGDERKIELSEESTVLVLLKATGKSDNKKGYPVIAGDDTSNKYDKTLRVYSSVKGTLTANTVELASDKDCTKQGTFDDFSKPEHDCFTVDSEKKVECYTKAGLPIFGVVKNNWLFVGFSTIDTDICDGAFKQSTPVAQLQAWIEETIADVVADCGSLKKVKVKDGSVKLDSTSTTVGATATVPCDIGFEPKKETIICQASGELEAAECEQIDCGSLPKVKDGSVKLDFKKTTFGSTATVSCDEGYEPSDDTITCQGSGKWEKAKCDIVDCGSLKKIKDGSLKLDSKKTTAGSTATVKCDDGYDPSVDTITCQKSGKWVKATCIIRDCGSLKKVKVKNGSVKQDSKSTTVGATATVSCGEGYEPVEETITCKISGEWEKAECDTIDCGGLSKVSDGSVKLDSKKTMFGSTATVSCDDGYDPKDESITCQASGKWEKAKCVIRDCGPLPEVSDGSLTLDFKSTTFGSTATLTCNSGYEPKSGDMVKISCEASRKWEKAKCVPKDCGTPSVSNGIVILDSTTTTFGSTATITCDAGYDESVSTIKCLATGSWEAAICIIKDCGNPSVSNGSLSLDSTTTTFGSTATVTCNAGYDASVSTINCLATGSWEAATCIIKDCGTPSVSNGTVILDTTTTTFGSTATITCDAGYDESVSTINCLATGSWEAATCLIKDCGTPSVSNGSVSLDFNTTTFGSTATVTCESGFNESVSTINCQASGSWETAICIIKDCGTPSVRDGTVSLDSTTTTFGSPATVVCDAGYDESVATIKCLATGSWEAATCIIRDCGIPSVSGGSVNLDSTASTFGSTANVTCDDGYKASVLSITCLASGDWENATCDSDPCKSGWTHFNNSCYYFHADGTTTFASAIDECISLGAYLVEITSAEENAFLVDLRDDPLADAFIGLTDREREGTFKWVTSGNGATYTNWTPGLPDSLDYIYMTAIGQWYTAFALETKYYFCEYDVSS